MHPRRGRQPLSPKPNEAVCADQSVRPSLPPRLHRAVDVARGSESARSNRTNCTEGTVLEHGDGADVGGLQPCTRADLRRIGKFFSDID